MKRPNVLLFLTDDHGAWANGCYGNSEVRSPNLDRLAAEGARFAHAFTPIPVCSPARACLMTGRTPSQVGLHDYLAKATGQNDWLTDELTLFQLLETLKYFRGHIGKWHMGSSGEVPRGVDWFVGPPGVSGSRFAEDEYNARKAQASSNGKGTEFSTDCALKFLQETPDEQPFFLNVNYNATHSPFAGQEPELVALYDDATFRDIPEYTPHQWKNNEGLVSGDYEPGNVRSYYAQYYAAVTDIDRNVGRILQRLEEQGRLDDTIVIYTSDHGCALGHHGFWGKGNSTRPLNMYETSLHVPLIVRFPQFAKAGTTVDHCVDHYDTFQTLCDLTGVELPSRNYPGQSYKELLEGAAIDWDDTTYGEYGDLRMIRTPQWKLVRRYPDGPDDLFDLQSDPTEKTNLAEVPEFSSVRSQLLQQLEEWYTRHEDPQKSGLRVKLLPVHNGCEAWRDGIREERGLQVYGTTAAMD